MEVKGKAIVGVLVAAVVSVGVIAVGYHKTKQMQAEQNDNYLTELVMKDKEIQPAVRDVVDNLYETAEWVFLKPDITQEAIKDAAEQVMSLRISSGQVVAQDEKLQQEIKGLAKEQNRLFEGAKLADTKFTLQQAISELFETPIENFQDLTVIPAIKEDVTSDKLTAVSDQVKVLKQDQFKANATGFLDAAEQQATQIAQVRQTIANLMPNGVVAEGTTLVQQGELVAAIQQIENATVQVQLMAQADEMLSQLYGNPATSEATTEAVTN